MQGSPIAAILARRKNIATTTRMLGEAVQLGRYGNDAVSGAKSLPCGDHHASLVKGQTMTLFQILSKSIRDPLVVLATFGTMVGVTILAASWPFTTFVAVAFFSTFFGFVLCGNRTR